MDTHLKSNTILSIFLLMLFVVIAGGSYLKPDYNNYKLMYEGLDSNSIKDFGFFIIIQIGRFLRLNYNQFQLLLFSVGYLIIAYTCIRYFKVSVLFFGLYFLYPFFWDAVQIRNFLGMSLLILSIKFVLERSPFKFLLTILIACSIHLVFIFYLPIYIISSIKIKNYFVVLLFGYAVGLILLVSLSRQENQLFLRFVSNFYGLFNDNRLYIYSKYKMNFGHFLYIGLQLTGLLIIQFVKNEIYRTQDKYQLSIINMIQNINIYVIIFMPFYLLESTYFRFYRNIYVVNQLILIIVMSKLEKTKDTYILYILIIGYSILVMYFDLFRPLLRSVVIPVLSSNYLF